MVGISHCDKAQCGIVTLENGTRLYVSYSTVVGIDTPNGDAAFTERRYSVTTSKQLTTKLFPAAGFNRVKRVSHAEFLALCAPHGLIVDGYERVNSPHSFWK
jgi:hypothetical protein